jgi:aminomuconate-semialdehyde/2-hydroxymuconate-6-semialdehyde dehydrogenase
MGGKNPIIIFDDCNYDKALQTVVRSSFTNQGEICLCGSRIYIQENIYEKFREDFVRETNNLKVGNPLDNETNIGAVVSKQHFEKIMSYIELAKKEGGKIIAGGAIIKPKGLENGLFISPTIIEGLSNDCRTNQEEIFGPVVTISPFKSEEDALSLANESIYGLACSIWTENISRANRMSREIRTGIVWINTWLNRDLRTPFGGMKDSGVGREGGWEAMRFFTEAKNVCIQY